MVSGLFRPCHNKVVVPDTGSQIPAKKIISLNIYSMLIMLCFSINLSTAMPPSFQSRSKKMKFLSSSVKFMAAIISDAGSHPLTYNPKFSSTADPCQLLLRHDAIPREGLHIICYGVSPDHAYVSSAVDPLQVQA